MKLLLLHPLPLDGSVVPAGLRPLGECVCGTKPGTDQIQPDATGPDAIAVRAFHGRPSAPSGRWRAGDNARHGPSDRIGRGAEAMPDRAPVRRRVRWEVICAMGSTQRLEEFSLRHPAVGSRVSGTT